MGGNEQYVMDVVLKKAYSNGWLGNFEGEYQEWNFNIHIRLQSIQAKE